MVAAWRLGWSLIILESEKGGPEEPGTIGLGHCTPEMEHQGKVIGALPLAR